MKYCTKCGHQLEAGQQFCTNCGAKQPDVTAATEPTQADVKQSVDSSSLGQKPIKKASGGVRTLWIVIAAVAVVILGVAGHYGSNTYKRNHLTEQEIANIGDDVASKYLGSDEVNVYYNKSDNEMTMVAKSGTALYDRAEDSVSYYGNIDSLSSYVSKFKKISAAMSPKMPTDLKNVRVEFMNPANTNRYLYITENGKVTYDFTVDDDD